MRDRLLGGAKLATQAPLGAESSKMPRSAKCRGELKALKLTTP